MLCLVFIFMSGLTLPISMFLHTTLKQTFNPNSRFLHTFAEIFILIKLIIFTTLKSVRYGGPYRSNKINISKTLAENTIHSQKRKGSQKTQNTHRKHNTLSETNTLAQKTQYTHRNENTHRKRKTQYTHRKHNTLTENTIHSQKTKYTFLLRWPPYSVYRNRIP